MKNRELSRQSLFISGGVLPGFLCLLGLATTAQGGEKPNLFEKIERRLSSSPQVEISFKHIVVSEFFDTADTLQGKVTFTNDGRYLTDLGQDQYLFDGECLWEYSLTYAQATRNCLEAGQRIDDSFLFFRNFEEYYSITEETTDSVYKLTILPERRGGAPDSLRIVINPGAERIETMEYYDINEELNLLVIGKESFFETIDSLLFSARFPDSVEIIEIPD